MIKEKRLIGRPSEIFAVVPISFENLRNSSSHLRKSSGQQCNSKEIFGVRTYSSGEFLFRKASIFFDGKLSGIIVMNLFFRISCAKAEFSFDPTNEAFSLLFVL